VDNSIKMFVSVLATAAALAGSAVAAECPGPNVRITEAEKKFAVILPAAAGMESQSFDDIGCSVLSRNSECASRQSTFDGYALVADYLTGEQVPVEKAFFVLKANVKTPREYGIVAFKEKAHALKFSAEHDGGNIVMWPALIDSSLK